ncbi:retrovirus-related pol polyprotein from transposon TNT 1-94 [Tanacetum coccineum]
MSGQVEVSNRGLKRILEMTVGENRASWSDKLDDALIEQNSEKPLVYDLIVPLKVVQIVLWYLDSDCSKHMTKNLSKLINFVSKFLGTVRFGNDHIAKIMGYGDYQMENVTISRVYYVEGLGHNLFFVGQFCDSDLEVAFRKHTCFICDLDGVDLLKGSRGSNLYTLFVDNLLLSSPRCLLFKATKTKSWLWHRRLSHLNFDYINSLAKQGLVRGLPKLKYQKDHLYSACALSKSKKHSYKPKAEDSIQEKLYLLHMDLCGPMRVKFLRSKNEVPEFVIKFLKMIQVRLNATVRNIRIDNNTEFVNQTLKAYYEEFRISHQTSVALTPQQNGVVERRSGDSLLYTKPIINPKTSQQTPYELLHDRKPDLSYLHVFGALCNPTNDGEDLGKLKQKADIGIFLTTMTSEQFSSGPGPKLLTPGTISSGCNLVLKKSSTQVVIPNLVHSINQPPEHINKWTKDHPIDNVIVDPSRPVSIRQQLQDEALFYYFDAFLSSIEPKSYKDALTESCWIEAMQKELNEFERLKKSKLGEDPQGKAVDPTCYRGMIDTLIYLTARTINMGLWYPKDSCIALTAFVDADHASCQDTRKSTSRSMQLLGDRLEQVENGVVELYFIRIEYQLTDIFTKPLTRERLEFLIKKLGMQSMSSETLKKLPDEEEE